VDIWFYESYLLAIQANSSEQIKDFTRLI